MTPAKKSQKSTSTPSSDSAAVLQQLKSSKAGSKLVLIVAPDSVRRQRAEKAVIETLVPKSSAANSPVRRDLSDMNTRDLEATFIECATPSLFQPVTVLVLRNAESLDAAGAKKLAGLLQDIPLHLQVLISATSLPAQNALRKIAASNGYTIELAELSGPEISAWIKKECAAQGIEKPDPALISLIGEYSEQNPDTAAGIIQHLALYLDSTSASAADLKKLFSHDSVSSEFEFIDQLASAPPGKLEHALTALLHSGKSPFALIGLIFRSYSQYYQIRALDAAGTAQAEIARIAGAPPWLVKKHLSTSRPYSQQKLIAALRAVLKADSTLKNRSLGAEAVFSSLTAELRP